MDVTCRSSGHEILFGSDVNGPIFLATFGKLFLLSGSGSSSEKKKKEGSDGKNKNLCLPQFLFELRIQGSLRMIQSN